MRTVPSSLPPVYSLPGWQGSGATHWQSRWERAFGDRRVEQDDWWQPRRGDWMARLEEVLLADPRLPDTPALLVAHSLGCHLVAAWAAHSRHTERVAGALLVAPPDTSRDDLPPQLQGWRRAVTEALPFPAVTVLSEDDPFGALDRTSALAAAWGAGVVVAGRRGHLNGESGLGDWPEGRALLTGLTGLDR